jgi:GNAT superfamily N-acetyltransferase
MQMLPVLRADLPYIGRLSPEAWGDITPNFVNYISLPFCHPFKALQEGMPVGLGAIIENEDTVWLAQIIVHPSQRNKGIGKAITQYLVDSVDRHRFKTIMLDATHFGFPVYKSLGFEVVAEHVHFTGKVLDLETDYAHIIPFEERYRQDVYCIDRLASGERRQNSLDSLLDGALLYVTGNTVRGVYFASSAKGCIIAGDAEAGIELMKCRLSARDTCMLPAGNKIACNFLLQNGFEHVRTSHRMRLGPEPAWDPTYIFNCMSGALG